MPGEDNQQTAEWTAFIAPFASAIGMSVDEVTGRLRPLVGEPEADAADALRTEE